MAPIFGALCAIFIVSIALAACGGDDSGVPSGSVANVGGTKITNDTFNHWVSVAIKGSQQQGSTAEVAVPDPPDYTQCIATKRKSLPKPPKARARPPTRSSSSSARRSTPRSRIRSCSS